MKTVLLVACGGACGAVLRYLISLIPFGTNFPFATFFTNLAGAFAIGLITGLVADSLLSANASAFLKTGVCGGFTTFSTFSLEAYRLLTNGHPIIGGAYVVLSVGLAIIGVFLGLLLAKVIALR